MVPSARPAKGTAMSTTTDILIAAGGFVALAAAAPMLLPSSARVTRRAVVAAQPAAVYEMVSGNAGFQRFNPWRDTDPNLEIALSGPASGVGSAFAFSGRDGSGTQTIVAVEDNRRVESVIDMGPMGKPTLTFELAPVSGGTEVTWRMDSRFGFNPMGRVFGLVMDRVLGPVAERGLKNLDRTLGGTA